MSLPKDPQSWRKDEFLISTNKSLLSRPAINAAFAQDFLYWTNAFPDDILQQIIDNCFCFGLYKVIDIQSPSDSPSNLQQIGFARLVTDNITFAYLTDVYILPEFQGLGLGGLLIDCLDQIIRPLPHLWWFMLRTGSEKSRQSYENRLEMEILGCGSTSEGAIMMGRKGKGNMA
ncbi:hypothetical protein FE257_006298 [Aspergillus nanangensis]|uniref:N-acetyltransferase domain-containing protein n=1 Tax=Aspergillus nanangensis TaxID=2582783 RepID=A0AAD4CPM4_ASPNN|nr:hypothetical protein FE257_006298 [Aspergillus nanangensis]